MSGTNVWLWTLREDEPGPVERFILGEWHDPDGSEPDERD